MMPSIAIVTDTDASLPAYLAAKHGIRQVPISVLFGEESLQTGIDIDDAKLFERVDREGKLPTTAAPAPGDFVKAFQQAFDDGADSVVCFCVSGAVSATYDSALVAWGLMPERSITVVDSRTLSMGQGFMALVAAEAAREGASADEIVARATSVRDRTYLYAALSTLRYLAMSGRVGHLAAGMAGMLNVKPILTIQEGKLDLLEKVRTQKKAWARAIELTGEALAGRAVERMAILHAAAPDSARQFEALVREEIDCPPGTILAELTPGLSVHAGAGLVGAVVVAAE
jgi:DegV family protein with EDD domain